MGKTFQPDSMPGRLQGEFTVAYFGAAGPGLEYKTLSVPREGHEVLFERYAVESTATYVFRPDGHVLARCTGIDAASAREAIEGVFNYRIGNRGSETAMPSSAGKLTQTEIDRLYDALAEFADKAEERERALARLVVVLAERVGDYGKVLDAIKRSSDWWVLEGSLREAAS